MRVFIKILSLALCISTILCLNIPASQPHNADAQTGLIAHWTFDEGSGTIAHDSARSNDGTIYGNPTWVDGVSGKALHLDGNGDYIKVNDSNTLGFSISPFSISLWFKTTDSNEWLFIDKRACSDHYQGVLLASQFSQLHFAADDCSTTSCGGHNRRITAPYTYSDNKWHNVVSMRDSNHALSIYVDGVLQSTQVFQSSDNVNNNNYLYIGTRFNAADFYYSGLIDDVRIYDRALSTQEVIDLHNEFVPPIPTPTPTPTPTPIPTPTPTPVPGNLPPNKPTAISPINEDTVSIDDGTILYCTDFADPDPQDYVSERQWQITTTQGDYNNAIFDDTDNGWAFPCSCVIVPQTILKTNSTYYWRVRYKDNHGEWSEWSAEAAFKTNKKVVLLVHGFRDRDWPHFNDWTEITNYLTDYEFLNGYEFPEGIEIKIPLYNQAQLDPNRPWVTFSYPIGPYNSNGKFTVYVSNYSENIAYTPGLPWVSGGTWGDIKDYARNLKREIDVIKKQEGVNKVDIFSHSQGGIVSRTYIESEDFGPNVYTGDIGKLIMAGTPNHGAVLTPRSLDWLLGPFINLNEFDDPGIAPLQLLKDSPFLCVLNYGLVFPGPLDIIIPDVDYYTIAGQKNGLDIDGLVEVDSVRLDGVPIYKVISDHDRLKSNESVLYITKNILEGNHFYWPYTDPIPQYSPVIRGEIHTDEQNIHQLLISESSEVVFIIKWLEGELTPTLISPTGIIIDPSVAETAPNITYELHSDLSYFGGYIASYAIDSPEQGSWILNVDAGNVSEEGTRYVAQAYLLTDITLNMVTPATQVAPNDPIDIVAELTHLDEGIASASVVATIYAPGNMTYNLSLYNDGLHNDEAANDGIYGNVFTNTSVQGVYIVKTTASGSVNGEPFERQADAAMWVQLYPDLRLDTSDIVFSNNTPDEENPITISANVHNIGQADANNTEILFYDGDPKWDTLIGNITVTIPAGQTIEVSVPWSAVPGDHNIYVGPSPFNTFMEIDYSNNVAIKSIHVTGPIITAVAGGPYEADEGSPIIFDAKDSTGINGEPLEYRWDYNSDGGWDFGWSINTIAVDVKGDDYDGTATLDVSNGSIHSRATVFVKVNNVAPTVECGEDLITSAGMSQELSISFEDPGWEDTHTATIDWGDIVIESGIVSEFDGNGNVTGTHTYQDIGTYLVTISVEDDDGGISTESLIIVVDNIAPIANAGESKIGHESSTFTFTGSYLDPDINDTHIYEWDFDYDGVAFNVDATGNDVVNTWADDFNGSVALRVTDDNGAFDIDTCSVIVNNVAPTVYTGADQTINEGDIVAFSGTFTDPGLLDTHTILWDFGDGSNATATLTPTHTYADNGFYTVTLTVTDDDGGVGTDTAIVTVNNIAPTVEAGSGATIYTGNTFSSSGLFTDPGTDTWTATANYGDGSGYQELMLSGKNFTLSHVYNNSGIYTITVTVIDKDGGTGSDTAIVTVLNSGKIQASIQLKDSNGTPLSNGLVQYYSAGWQSIGTTDSNGIVNKELAPGTYSFSMTYGGGRQEKSQNISTDSTVVFQTKNVTVQLKDSAGNLIDTGTVQYYAGGWKAFGTTSGGQVSMELLPLTYSFSMTYGGARQEKSQNISTDTTVVFQTMIVTVQLTNSTGTLIDTGIVQYYAGGWKTFGTTSGGQVSMELLPLTYSFSMTYGGARQEKSQNISTDSTVVFQTGQVHSDSASCIQYYASGWRTFNQDIQLLPVAYTFRFNDITADTSYIIVAGIVNHIH